MRKPRIFSARPWSQQKKSQQNFPVSLHLPTTETILSPELLFQNCGTTLTTRTKPILSWEAPEAEQTAGGGGSLGEGAPGGHREGAPGGFLVRVLQGVSL